MLANMARVAEKEQKRQLPFLGFSFGLLALAAVVGLSVLVGYVGAPRHERFDWTLASVFGTALGTTLLALATGGLAWSTRSKRSARPRRTGSGSTLASPTRRC
jgi:hypothetical protein